MQANSKPMNRRDALFSAAVLTTAITSLSGACTRAQAEHSDNHSAPDAEYLPENDYPYFDYVPEIT